ncbi:MAG TPA: hypothetical protein VN723_02335 [Rhizomicrobium sp.]|jgi:hypothetical protein|nr:hypothetical protein [Rhizomicrobium sp.]
MNIEDMIREEYRIAVAVTENTARRFPPGSPQRERWLMVAGVYRECLAPAGAAGPDIKRAMRPETS